MTMDLKVSNILKKGIVNIIPEKGSLADLLNSDKKLNVYLGIDPTATRIHLGHTIPLRKLQAFVELGHNVKFLIGDFTALIGDTSDKDKERPVLTIEEIKENFKTYKEQASKFVDFSKAEVVFNSEWLGKLTFTDIVKLAQHFSVGDFVGRELVKNRLAAGLKVGLHETLYPLMQGYDSYHLKTDIQIGGADQTFNMQAGRKLISDLDGRESYVLVTDYLPGTDGRKMSKSWNNAIWINDDPDDMYAKIMTINDELIERYYRLVTNLGEEEVDSIITDLNSGGNPLAIKMDLAQTILTEIYDRKTAEKAELFFYETFQKKTPEYSRTVDHATTVVETIRPLVSGASIAESRRLITQGAVEINGIVVTNPKEPIIGGENIQVGKKIFVHVKEK